MCLVGLLLALEGWEDRLLHVASLLSLLESVKWLISSKETELGKSMLFLCLRPSGASDECLDWRWGRVLTPFVPRFCRVLCKINRDDSAIFYKAITYSYGLDWDKMSLG